MSRKKIKIFSSIIAAVLMSLLLLPAILKSQGAFSMGPSAKQLLLTLLLYGAAWICVFNYLYLSRIENILYRRCCLYIIPIIALCIAYTELGFTLSSLVFIGTGCVGAFSIIMRIIWFFVSIDDKK